MPVSSKGSESTYDVACAISRIDAARERPKEVNYPICVRTCFSRSARGRLEQRLWWTVALAIVETARWRGAFAMTLTRATDNQESVERFEGRKQDRQTRRQTPKSSATRLLAAAH